MISRRNILSVIGAGLTTATLSLSAIPALAGMAGPTGTFDGMSNHLTSGSVSIVEEGGTYYVELGEDFSLDGGPDPRVALGNDGYDANAVLGELENLTGSSRYEIPANLDVSDFNEVWIWCEVASVPLGVAALN
ncbi:DM13 domain-containing protein [Cochlodiniinecator piscidefendens]|uniref:DM13 domain-containing protein n=1 Tax=Cochlodiniinecator piscidefendens TaxID=2715756 RepID=UPI0014073427|nr:DM13 domain-containing protein [Cochlodiniinecator piscidefendens]